MAVSTSSAEFREAPEAQDWAALGDWLAAQGMQLDAREPRQFAGGLANLNYLIHVDGTPVVLRRPPGGALAEGASDMGREARVLSLLPDHYPLAPRSIAYCADRDVIGAEFQLIEYRPGVTIRDGLPEQMRAAPGIGGELTRRYVEALAALHSIDAEAAGLSGLARRPEGFVRRQTDGWERRARVAFGGDVPEPAGRILAWLRDNQPPPGGVGLLHNDFKFDNLIVDPATGRSPGGGRLGHVHARRPALRPGRGAVVLDRAGRPSGAPRARPGAVAGARLPRPQRAGRGVLPRRRPGSRCRWAST